MNGNDEQQQLPGPFPASSTTGATLNAVHLEQEDGDGRSMTLSRNIARPVRDVQVRRRRRTVWRTTSHGPDDLPTVRTVRQTTPRRPTTKQQARLPSDVEAAARQPRPEGIDLSTFEAKIEWEDIDEDDTDQENVDQEDIDQEDVDLPDWVLADPHYRNLVTDLARLARARRLRMGDQRNTRLERIGRNLIERGVQGSRRGDDVRSAMTEAADDRPSSERCKICLDDIDEAIHAGCRHTFCKCCINQYIKHSLQDRISFPPMCCGRVLAIENVREHLDTDVLLLVDARWQEWSDNSPVYCFDCSRYLKEIDADGQYKHCSCGCSTCVVCKIAQTYHLVEGVHPEQVDHQVQQLASKKGWKECPGCLTLVEKRTGCDQMQCSCKTFFCYRCGRRLPDQMPCRCRARDVDLEAHARGPV